MNPSGQKVFLFSFLLSGYCATLIDSFGQHDSRSSIIHFHPVGRRHGHDRLHHQNSARGNGVLLPLYSTTGNRGEVRRKETWKKSPYIKYENRIVVSQFARFNSNITKAESAEEILELIASRKGALTINGGGGKLSTVNFSTSIHRIARHVTQYTSKNKPGNDRGKILSDPRFALMMCSVAEAVLDGAEDLYSKYDDDSLPSKNQFGPREIANVAWAIAKINIAPPESVMPVDIENAESLLREKSQIVRSAILDVAKQRATSGASSRPSSSLWIQSLSELCGLMIDTMSAKALELNPKNFQQQELSNIMWALAITQRPNQQVFEFVVTSIIESASARKHKLNCNKNNPNFKNTEPVKGMMPQEWSIPLWVLAKAGTGVGKELELVPFVEDMMSNESGFLQRFKPQELSNSAWAVATIISKHPQIPRGATNDGALGILRHTSREIIRRQGDRYKTQELTNHAWAMATLGFGIKASQTDEVAECCPLTHSYTYVLSDDPKGDKELMEKALEVVFDRAKQNLSRFPSQELNNLCWAMARLERKDEDLLKMIGRELSNPRRSVNSQDLSTSLWAMATMEYFDDKLYRSIVARYTDISDSRIKPREYSNTAWALATAGVAPKYMHAFDDAILSSEIRPTMKEAMSDPVTYIFGTGAVEFSLRPDEFKTQEIKDLTWAFARIGMRHPKLFRSVAEHLVGTGDHQEVTGRGLNEFNTQGIANLAYSFARHCQLGAETMEKFRKGCRIPMAGGRLACQFVAYSDVGEGLVRKLFVEIARAGMEVHDDLQKFTTQDISNTLWSYGVIGLKHQRMLDVAASVMQKRMESYVAGDHKFKNVICGQEMGNLLWAFAALDYKPSGMLTSVEQYWMAQFDGKPTVSRISKYISRQEMANIAWAAAVFGEYPRKLIEILYNGILGVTEGLDPEYMEKTLYNDNGLSRTHFNSLLYLQIMMDLELGVDQNPFSLPENFPSAWTSNPTLAALFSDSETSSSPRESNSAMELTTSAFQRRVSMAFDRIDFGHVDEYSLSMKDLVDDFGIQIPPLPTDILSLDLASEDPKIGVEVDGPGHWNTIIDPLDNPKILSSVGEWKKSRSIAGMLEYSFHWNSGQQVVNGSTSLKQRLFDQLGWRIINIPFWEWVPVDHRHDGDGDKVEKFEAQNDYCRSLLANQEGV